MDNRKYISYGRLALYVVLAIILLALSVAITIYVV